MNFTTFGTLQQTLTNRVKLPYQVVCAVVADVDKNGYDDLILCNKDGKPRIFTQKPTGIFEQLDLPSASRYIGTWMNVRVGRILGGKAQSDLVVVEGGLNDLPTFLHIFEGIPDAPYFKFNKPYYTTRLPVSDFFLKRRNRNLVKCKVIYSSTTLYNSI